MSDSAKVVDVSLGENRIFIGRMKPLVGVMSRLMEASARVSENRSAELVYELHMGAGALVDTLLSLWSLDAKTASAQNLVGRQLITVSALATLIRVAGIAADHPVALCEELGAHLTDVGDRANSWATRLSENATAPSSSETEAEYKPALYADLRDLRRQASGVPIESRLCVMAATWRVIDETPCADSLTRVRLLMTWTVCTLASLARMFVAGDDSRVRSLELMIHKAETQKAVVS